MPQVVVTIDGKTFRMACAEGEEDHLASLAAEVDVRVNELRRSFGEIGDQRLVVMAAIMATDELSEQRRRVASLEAEIAAARRDRDEALRRVAADERRFVSHMNEVAAAIETVAGKIDGRS
jgi:cell division protein ZapA